MKLSNLLKNISFWFVILQTFYFSVTSDSSSGSSMIRKMSRLNWKFISKNDVNYNCTLNPNGTCSGTCPLTSKKCVILWNYDTMVCGCHFCSFNATTKKCYGQCNNLALGNCISIVDNPTRDSDCSCRYCQSSVRIRSDGTILPNCNGNRCLPHTCSSVMMSANATTTNLECVCNNF